MPTVARIVGNQHAETRICEFLENKGWRSVKGERKKGHHFEITCNKRVGSERVDLHLRITVFPTGNKFLTCFSLTDRVMILSTVYFLGQWEYFSMEELEDTIISMGFYPLANVDTLLYEVFVRYDLMAEELRLTPLFR